MDAEGGFSCGSGRAPKGPPADEISDISTKQQCCHSAPAQYSSATTNHRHHLI